MSTYEANRYAFPASAITSGTFANARLSSGSVTQHVDLTSLSADNLTSGTVPSARLSLGASDIPNLATSKITSGTFDNARISSGSVTQHVSSVTNTTGTWSPGVQVGSLHSVSAVYAKVGKMCFCRCLFYTSGTSSYQSGTLFRLTGLPFTSRNGNTYAGGGTMWGPSYRHDQAQILVEDNATTAVLASTNESDRSPYLNIDQNGSLVRRHSFYDASDKYYVMFFIYATAS